MFRRNSLGAVPEGGGTLLVRLLEEGLPMKFKQRQSVRHAKYGWGTILEQDDHYTTVFFHTVGVRKLTVSEAVFKVVEDQGPKKKPGG